MYSVKEIFYTLQGEGLHTGRCAVFCRFAGCNLWTGRPQDRDQAICTFCDTDFVGVNGTNGGRYTCGELARRIEATWPFAERAHRFVVFTGGEPLLQLNAELVRAVKEAGFFVSVETNGTQSFVEGIDWLCMSPKTTPNTLRLTQGDELKFVYPQERLTPDMFIHLNFRHFTLQPMDNPFLQENIQKAFAYCQSNPKWRLGLQTHKIIGCP